MLLKSNVILLTHYMCSNINRSLNFFLTMLNVPNALLASIFFLSGPPI